MALAPQPELRARNVKTASKHIPAARHGQNRAVMLFLWGGTISAKTDLSSKWVNAALEAAPLQIGTGDKGDRFFVSRSQSAATARPQEENLFPGSIPVVADPRYDLQSVELPLRRTHPQDRVPRIVRTAWVLPRGAGDAHRISHAEISGLIMVRCDCRVRP